MTAFEIGVILIFGASGIALFAAMVPRSTIESLQEFTRQCSASGMDSEETGAAIAIRIAFARLRRTASDRCMEKQGDLSRKEMNEIAGELAIGLAASYGKEAATSFMGWVDACPDHEILYDDARAARHRRAMKSIEVEPTTDPDLAEDMRAAFRIVK